MQKQKKKLTEEQKESRRQFYKDNPDYFRNYRNKHRAKNKEYQATYRKEHKAENALYREFNRINHRALDKENNRTLKIEVLEHYCSSKIKCKDCGNDDLEVLTIDHINSIGRKHRKKIGGHLYRWLKKNKYPKGYQVLCMNCQFIKRYKKYLEDYPNSKHRKRIRKLKIDAISHYSKGAGKCKKCECSDIITLTIDHIHNKGSLHKRELKIEGWAFYQWLKKNNYPKGYQVLCINFNVKKAIKDNVWKKI